MATFTSGADTSLKYALYVHVCGGAFSSVVSVVVLTLCGVSFNSEVSTFTAVNYVIDIRSSGMIARRYRTMGCGILSATLTSRRLK